MSDGGAKLRETLSSLVLDTPTGKVKLDKNRNAIADMFLTEVVEESDGTLYNKLVKVIPQVNQTLGIPEDEFLKLGKVTPRQSELPVGSEERRAPRGLRCCGNTPSKLRRARAGARWRLPPVSAHWWRSPTSI